MQIARGLVWLCSSFSYDGMWLVRVFFLKGRTWITYIKGDMVLRINGVIYVEVLWLYFRGRNTATRLGQFWEKDVVVFRFDYMNSKASRQFLWLWITNFQSILLNNRYVFESPCSASSNNILMCMITLDKFVGQLLLNPKVRLHPSKKLLNMINPGTEIVIRNNFIDPRVLQWKDYKGKLQYTWISEVDISYMKSFLELRLAY